MMPAKQAKVPGSDSAWQLAPHPTVPAPSGASGWAPMPWGETACAGCCTAREMDAGRIVERGETAAIFGAPEHATTQRLLASARSLGHRRAQRATTTPSTG